MAGVFTIPRENLEFIAQDIGEQLIEFISPALRLKGMKPEERLHGLSSADLALLTQKIVEERRWLELAELDSAEKRITFITNLTPEARAVMLDEAHRDRLLHELNAEEQTTLIAWVEDSSSPS